MQTLDAPNLGGITNWINSDPLSLDDLRGHVVGIEFWAHSCGNCAKAMPEMEKLYQKFRKKGFVLIGFHSPELETDKKITPIRNFIKANNLSFPVAIDNDMVVWQRYNNRYWPTLYLIDKHGKIRERHIGEGGYHRIEQDIEYLLKED